MGKERHGHTRLRLSRTRKRMFYMYCALIAAVLAMLIPVYRQVMRSQKEEAYRSYHYFMRTGLSQFEAEVANTLNAFYAFRNNENFKKMAIFDDKTNLSRHYLAYDTLKQIQNMALSQTAVSDIELLFAQNDLHFTSQRLFTSMDEYYGTFFAFEGMTKQEYENMERNALASTKILFFPAQRGAFFREEAKDIIVCYAPLFIAGQLSQSCGVFLFIDVRAVSRAADFQELGGTHVIADSAGQILYYSGCTQEEAATLLGRTGETSVYWQGRQRDLHTFSGNHVGLQYYWCIPPEAYNNDGWMAMGVMILCVCAAIAVGLLLALTMTRIQYEPIRKLQGVVQTPRPNGEGREDEGDEYAVFANAYLAAQKNNEVYRARIQEMNSVLVANVFEKILWHVGDAEEATAWLHEHLPYRLPTAFRLVEVRVHPLDAALEEEKGADEGAEEETMQENDVEIISAMLSELLPKYWDTEIFVHPLNQDNLVFLIPDSKGEKQIIEDKLSNICQYIHRAFDVAVIFGVSRSYEGTHEIHTAFMQTRRMLSELNELPDRMAQNAGIVLFVEDRPERKTNIVFNQHTIDHLSNYIATGNAAAACKLIGRLIAGCTADFEGRVQLFYNIRAVIEVKYHELDKNLKKTGMLGHEPIMIPSFSGGSISEEMFSRLSSCCTAVCDQYARAYPNGALPMKDRILEYIADNYADPELYGKLVASKFNLSEKYLYTYFKKQMGVGFAEYLEALRLHRAEELLSSSRMSVSEIAAKVGFNSHNTFYKAFKRKYGITPSQYRNTSISYETPESEAYFGHVAK